MSNLLKFQWNKLFKTKSFIVSIIVSVVLNIGLYITSYKLDVNSCSTGIKNIIGTTQGVMPIVLVIFIACFVCVDYTNGVMKNIIARGYKRSSVAFAAYIVIVIATVILYVISALSRFAIATILKGVGDVPDMFVPGIFFQIFALAGFAALYFMLSEIFKKTAPTIVIYFGAQILFSMFVPMIENYIHTNLISKYWIEGVLSTANNMEPFGTGTLILAGACAAYIVVSLVITSVAVSKNEV